MKNIKSHKTERSRPSSRSFAPSAKSRDSEGGKAKTPSYKGVRGKTDSRSSEKPRFGEKSRFGDKPEFGKKSRFGDKSKTGEKASYGERTRYGEKSRFADKGKFGEKARSGEKTWFGDKSKPGVKPFAHAKAKDGDKAKFGDKPRFEDKEKPAYRSAGKTRSAPRSRAPKAEARESDFKIATDAVLIWGMHAARAAFLNEKRRITRLWLTESGQKLFESVQKEARDELLLKRPDAKRVDRDELDKITPPGSVHQGIVIETMPLPEVSLNDVISINPPPNLILMLDQVTDPHNVGAILRSAAAFGAGAIIMTERNAPTTTGVLAKSASGALEHTPMIHVVNLARALDDLREAGYWCVGLAEEGAKNLGDLDLSGRTVLVLGNEGDGLRHLTRQKCDELARLPTGGPVGSLNVSNAAAVGLYEVRKQAK